MSVPDQRPSSALVFDGVTLVLATDGTTTAVPGLRMVVDAQGVTTYGPEPASVRAVPWSLLAGPRFGEPGSLAGGVPAFGLTAVMAGRPVRWLVPATQLSADGVATLNHLLRAATAAAGPPAAGSAAAGPDGTAPPATAAPAPPAATPPAPAPAPPVVPPSPAPPSVVPPPVWAPAPPVVPPPVWTPTPFGTPPPPPDPTGAPAPAPTPTHTPAPGWSPPAPGGAPAGWAPPTGGPPPGPPSTAPFGPSPYPGVPHLAEAGSPSTGRRPVARTLLVVGVAVLVLALALGLGLGLSRGGGTPTPTAGSASARAQQVAQSVNLSRGDVPTGWQVDASANGPISAFLHNGPASQTPAQKATNARLAAQYERCMGLSSAADRIFGSAGTSPLATAASPAFAAPRAQLMEAGSQVAVFASPVPVAADVAQVTGPRFPTCFGDALANEFNSLGAGAGANVGAPHVAQLTSLPEIGGVRAVGVALTLTATFAGQSATVQLGFVLAGGGRIESTLVTFAGNTTFPLALTRGMTATLERRMVQLGAGPGF